MSEEKIASNRMLCFRCQSEIKGEHQLPNLRITNEPTIKGKIERVILR